ncbi:MAG: amino-acid N-acetyltransferase [Treponema sp.]|nr:amino-acid N-acetyltransferase [Treponema sp.]
MSETKSINTFLKPFAIHDKAERVRDVLRYIRRFKNAIVVLHIDDAIIDSPNFTGHIRDICMIHEAGLRVLIVPGAKNRIDEVLSESKISWTLSNGLRITEENAMPLIKMAAFDVANKVMTSLAGEKYSAVIGNWVRSRGYGIREGVDYVTCGEIDKIQIDAIQTVLQNGFIPIFPCIGWNANGKPYNISSTQLATEIAKRLKAEKLFFLTANTSINAEDYIIPLEIILSDEGCVPAMNLEELEIFLKVNSATQNINTILLLKLAKNAIHEGVSRVHILNGTLDGTIPCEIFSDLGSGTMIYQNNYCGIRPMTRDDIPAVLTLISPFVQEGILLPRTEQELTETFTDYIVYELDGSIRACSALHQYNDEHGKQAEIAAVAVEKNCSQIGIGPKLVQFLIDKAKQNGNQSVFVMTTQSADWFEQQGFTLDDISSMSEKRKAKWSAERGSKLLRIKF